MFSKDRSMFSKDRCLAKVDRCLVKINRCLVKIDWCLANNTGFINITKNRSFDTNGTPQLPALKNFIPFFLTCHWTFKETQFCKEHLKCNSICVCTPGFVTIGLILVVLLSIDLSGFCLALAMLSLYSWLTTGQYHDIALTTIQYYIYALWR